jgi:hypothetical protein
MWLPNRGLNLQFYMLRTRADCFLASCHSFSLPGRPVGLPRRPTPAKEPRWQYDMHAGLQQRLHGVAEVRVGGGCGRVHGLLQQDHRRPPAALQHVLQRRQQPRRRRAAGARSHLDCNQ